MDIFYVFNIDYDFNHNRNDVLYLHNEYMRL